MDFNTSTILVWYQNRLSCHEESSRTFNTVNISLTYCSYPLIYLHVKDRIPWQTDLMCIYTNLPTLLVHKSFGDTFSSSYSETTISITQQQVSHIIYSVTCSKLRIFSFKFILWHHLQNPVRGSERCTSKPNLPSSFFWTSVITLNEMIA